MSGARHGHFRRRVFLRMIKYVIVHELLAPEDLLSGAFRFLNNPVRFAVEDYGYPASEKFMFSEAGSPLLDSQVPSPPQLCPWNLFLVLDGRLD